MAIYKGKKLIAGANYVSEEVVVYDTLEDMAAASVDIDTTLEDGTLGLVKGEPKLYVYYADNEEDEELGKWRLCSAEADKIEVEDNMPDEDGDIPVVQLPKNISDFTRLRFIPSTTAFTDNNIGGFVQNSQKCYRGQVVNRLKIMIGTPGWIRFGIIRGMDVRTCKKHGLAAAGLGFCAENPKYDSVSTYPNFGKDYTTCDGKAHTVLRKWLVVQYVATPGLHTFDFEDTVINDPCEYYFVEQRTGTAGFAYNKSGAAVTTTHGASIADGYANNGLAWPTTYITAANSASHNGKFVISNDVLNASARVGFCNTTPHGMEDCGWVSVSSVQPRIQNIILYNLGSLGIGLYKRSKKSDIVFQPLRQNAKSVSIGDTDVSALFWWIPAIESQSNLVGKKIFAIDLICITPGDFTIVHVDGKKNPKQSKILDVQTLRIRAVGPQRVHLNRPIIMQSDNEYVGVSGSLSEALWKELPVLTASSTAAQKQGYFNTSRFAHCDTHNISILNFDQFGDDTDENKVVDDCPYNIFSENKYELQSEGFMTVNNVKYIAGATAGTGRFDFSACGYPVGDGTFTDDYTQCNAYHVENYLNISFVVSEARRSCLEGLNVSITGDSISTYGGTVSKKTDFGTTNNQAGDNAICYPNYGSGLTNGVDSTWWGAFIKQSRARLLRNEAWSGSRCSGTESDTNSTAAASTIRVANLANTQLRPDMPNTSTTGQLAQPYGKPELILVMIGTNDLSGNIAAGSWSNTANVMNTILGSYQTMLAKMRQSYPEAKIVCFMMPRGTSVYPYTNTNGYSISQMAAGMEYVAKGMGAYFMPLSYLSAMQPYTTAVTGQIWSPSNGHLTWDGDAIPTASDVLHPAAFGHQIVAWALRKFCEENVVF